MVTNQQQEVREKLSQLASKHQCFNKEKASETAINEA